mmetsp:Transcript_23016/g.75016  ORF Transcript_23016/g.75016 Transcript_23016/m.75016 type:complete len:195 (+) Transcript_23016:22-606(+)|eukprot:CAMPEP_0170132490 /NCGR_PEP_ID=MMETSP0033_2-20121228/400_1 /TAXON_ID=195969 /ORGANISM="Dolichomastix tenuilepis, Strain CCMP3274" /LENGTH=194 /DNA_ID=CAMNT_0010367869 /DNA_START=18 /DNA_END=602 /DNA_ORIENTATION=+
MVQFPTDAGAEAGRWAPTGSGLGHHVPKGAAAASADGPDVGHFTVEVTSCNVKRIDMKIYNIGKPRCQTVLKVDGQSATTKLLPGLDPIFDETFTFTVPNKNNVSDVKFSGIFYMDEAPNTKQIGDEQFFLMDKFYIGKPTYKALIVPGGKVELMVTCLDFGKAEEEVDDTSFMDSMDAAEEGGMCMDSDEDED